MDGEGLKKLIIETAEETRRHMNVVAEDLKSDIRVGAEGVLANTERIDRLDTRVDHLEHEMRRESEEVRSMIRLS